MIPLARKVPAHRLQRDALDPEIDLGIAVAEIAHDLRSPLGAILFLSDALLARMRGSGDEISRRQLALIRGAALAMNGLVNDLRDNARGVDAILEARAVSFQLGDVVSSVEGLVRPLADELGLQFVIDAPPHVRCFGHPSALTRVLLNLCTNALKFTDRGRVSIAVEIVGSRMQITVRDTGRGLPPHVRALLEGGVGPGCDTASETRSQGVAVGLGLSICNRLVALMGGSMRLGATGPGGTTFLVDLPVAARTVPADAPDRCTSAEAAHERARDLATFAEPVGAPVLAAVS